MIPRETLRVLIVDDSESDAILLVRELSRGGFDVDHQRVDTRATMAAAVRGGPFDLVIADYTMPSFGGLAALALVHEAGLDLPFVVVSGTIGEERAVEVMRAGAHDFVLKDRLSRLVPVVRRELQDAAGRHQRREAERGLRSSEERFRRLVESMDDIVLTLDRDLVITGAFGRSLRKLGIGPDVLVGRSIEAVVGEDRANVHKAAYARALAGEPVVYEWVTDVGGAPRAFQGSLSSLRDDGGDVIGIVGVARDITERRKLQEHLVLSERMASVGTLAAGLAHEINNPLAVVTANLDFIAQELDETPARDAAAVVQEVRDPLTDARDAAERVRLIVRDLRIFSRGDDVRVESVDVRLVLESSLRMAWSEIRHRARLVKEFSTVPPVAANESRLGQVFLNLIMNAAHAIAEGSADQNQICVRTFVDAEGRVVVEIEDSGVGIPVSVRQRIFDPFFTTKPVGTGTGLGLAICHRIVSSLGGTIEVETSEGEGALFRTRLPAATDAATRTVSPSFGVATVHRARVLVVDDEPAVGRSIARILAAEHDITVLTRAREALVRIVDRGERYDVILCDLMMPEMTGVDLYAALVEGAPDQAARVVFATAGAFTARAREFLDRVPNTCIEKPIDSARLRAVVRAAASP